MTFLVPFVTQMSWDLPMGMEGALGKKLKPREGKYSFKKAEHLDIATQAWVLLSPKPIRRLQEGFPVILLLRQERGTCRPVSEGQNPK